MKEIRTSQTDWFPQVVRSYQNREPFLFVDDKGYGINLTESLLTAGLKGGLSPREWGAVVASFGVGVFGAALIVAAIVDPEPTSKLGLLIGVGALLTFTGAGNGIRILVDVRPPNVRVSSNGVEIVWGE